jgi:hypothetical protein
MSWPTRRRRKRTALAATNGRRLHISADQQRWSQYGRLWSQVVAVPSGVPANVVAVWSQSGDPTALSGPVTGPLSWGDSGAPRGIRTPNRQIRSQPSPVPARPPGPLAFPLVPVNGHVAGPTRASVPTRHARHGGNLVAVSAQRHQTGSLATIALLAARSAEHQIRGLVLYTWRDTDQTTRLVERVGRAYRRAATCASGRSVFVALAVGTTRRPTICLKRCALGRREANSPDQRLCATIRRPRATTTGKRHAPAKVRRSPRRHPATSSLGARGAASRHGGAVAGSRCGMTANAWARG